MGQLVIFMDKIYFQIEPRKKEGKTNYIARIQISDLLKKRSLSRENISGDVRKIENFYQRTVSFCRQKIARLEKETGIKKVSLYWEIADKLFQYLNVTEKMGYFLNDFYKHFMRDLRISETTVKRLLYLRKNIDSKDKLDPKLPWTFYTRRYYRLTQKAKPEDL